MKAVIISDAQARRVGQLTLLAILAVCGVALLAGLLSLELASIIESRPFWVTLAAIALSAYALACVTMVLHQRNAGSVSEDDVAEWSARQSTKLGLVIPFTYLLASPKERRILRYLGQRHPTPKPSRWYGSRF